MNNKKTDECIELKNIKYKTMLLSGNIMKETKTEHNLLNLNKFLEDDKDQNKIEPWSKLDKTVKTKKLITYAESYKNEKNLSSEEESDLIKYLKECLDRKKLQRVKDVDYDKETGEIKEIPALLYNKPTGNFILKNMDKRISTVSSLTPKKINKTIKMKNVDKEEEEQICES